MRHAPHLGWYLGLLSLSHGGLAFSQQALQDQEMVVSKSPAQEDLPIDPRHIISPKLSEDQIALARRSAAERPKRTAKLINGFRMQEEGNYVTRDEQDLIARDSLLQRMIETSDEGYSESIRLLEKHASSIQATPDAVFWGESDSGNPLYQVSQSVVAAKGISANLVWPGGALVTASQVPDPSWGFGIWALSTAPTRNSGPPVVSSLCSRVPADPPIQRKWQESSARPGSIRS